MIRRKEYVYFVQEDEDGPIKIGMTSNVTRRLEGLQRGNPRELHLRAAFRVLDPAQLERQLHERFAVDCLGGEWFSPTAAIEAAMDTLEAEFGRRDCPGCAHIERYLAEGCPPPAHQVARHLCGRDHLAAVNEYVLRSTLTELGRSEGALPIETGPSNPWRPGSVSVVAACETRGTET